MKRKELQATLWAIVNTHRILDHMQSDKAIRRAIRELEKLLEKPKRRKLLTRSEWQGSLEGQRWFLWK